MCNDKLPLQININADNVSGMSTERKIIFACKQKIVEPGESCVIGRCIDNIF